MIKPFLFELTPNLLFHCVLRVNWVLIAVLMLILLQVLFLGEGLGISSKGSSWTLFLIIFFSWILIGAILLIAGFYFIRWGLLLILLILLLCRRSISSCPVKHQIILNVVRPLIKVFNLKLRLLLFGFHCKIQRLPPFFVIIWWLKVSCVVFVVALRWISLSWSRHFI